MSKTRERFKQRRRERQAARKQEAYDAAHRFWCQGKRIRRGRMQTCMHEVRFRKAADGVAATCRKCGQLHRHYGGKWFKAEEYELERHDMRKEERQAQEGDYGYEPWYMPGERPNHDPDCGFKDFDLIGLHRVERKTVGGPGVIKIGIAMVDRFNVVRHWCRPAKS